MDSEHGRAMAPPAAVQSQLHNRASMVPTWSQRERLREIHAEPANTLHDKGAFMGCRSRSVRIGRNIINTSWFNSHSFSICVDAKPEISSTIECMAAAALMNHVLKEFSAYFLEQAINSTIGKSLPRKLAFHPTCPLVRLRTK